MPMPQSTASIHNPFALHPDHGAFQPHAIDELSTPHALGSTHHSSEGVYTRVFASSLFPSRRSLPPIPSAEKSSLVIPTLFHSLSDLPSSVSYETAPVYQEGQALAPAPSVTSALGPAAQYRQQRREARQRERVTLGALAGVKKEYLHKLFTFLDDRSLVRAGAVCRRFHSVSVSDKLWSPRVTALRRLLRSHNQPLPPRSSQPQWQQHATLLSEIAEPAMQRRVWGNFSAAAQLGDTLLVETMLHLGLRVGVGEAMQMLRVALRAGCRGMVAVLLQRAGGAALVEADADGRTPLHYARDAATVQMLLGYGADVLAVDAHGARAVDVAMALGLDDVVAVLQAATA